MTEHEQIWRDWETGRLAALSVSGQPAVVCVMGSQTYRAFLAALEIKLKGTVYRHTPYDGPITYEGIKVYYAQIMPLGMVFGHLEPKGTARCPDSGPAPSASS